MLPDPLHPAIVHFPVVLAVLIPLVAIGALWAIKRGANPLRAWGVTTAVAATLALSAWVAVETGEQQEERVEDTVGEVRIDRHAEAGETLMLTSFGLLAVVGIGLMPGAAGRVARYAGAAGTLATVVLAYNVGHSGGELVYKYNAGSAYASATTGAEGGEGGEGGERGEARGGKDAMPADSARTERGEKGERGEKEERGEKSER